MANERDNLKLTTEIYERFNKNDLDRWKSLLADNATIEVMPTNQTLKGPSDVIQYFRNYRQGFPDITINIQNQVACDDTVITEFVARGTHTGTLPTPMGDIPATGRKMENPVCQIVQWKNGKITDIRDYFDVATLMTQLGITSLKEAQTY